MIQKSIASVYNQIAEDYIRECGNWDRLSLPSLKQFVKFLPAGSAVLDVGCGGGRDVEFLMKKGFSVLGIDVSKKMISLAKKHAPETKFRVADITKFPTRKKFDGIWCCRVFNHISLKDQNKFLRKLKSLLRPGGILYLTSVVSDQKFDYEKFDSGNGNLLKKRLTGQSFKKLITGQGFTILKFKPWQDKKGMEIFARKLVR
jgi:2-polyprenyl-3-methyl-5-hydroxy-6-metoxy-1,4-benzoquinol methylase